MSNIVLIGAGGHARMVADAVQASGMQIALVIDPSKPSWIDAPHANDDAAMTTDSNIVLGLGGVTPDALKLRLEYLRDYLARGHRAPAVIHPSASVSKSATVSDGAQIAAKAVVQAFASIGAGAIVNTGAIVEHEAHIGEGSHVAPGAIVLGGANIGKHCMIGAGAVVLPQARLGDGGLVKALTRFGGDET